MIRPKQIVHILAVGRHAGCYDALSAKCLQKAGHKAAFVSGYAVSAGVLHVLSHAKANVQPLGLSQGQLNYRICFKRTGTGLAYNLHVAVWQS